MTTIHSRTVFEGLSPQQPDGLLALIGAYRADPRPDKLDLGVGVYRDDHGQTPVFRAVKAAERLLVERQQTKAYLGPEGDIGFLEHLKPIVFGARPPRTRVFGVQTPGGTGALRLAAELLAAGRPGGRLFVGTPTWPNHPQIFEPAGIKLVRYSYFDPVSQTVRFDAMMEALETASAGDAVLLQACCHNPTGADLTPGQWDAVADLIDRRGLTPLIDQAYQGLALGLDADAAGLRRVLEAAPEALVAYSCDKNFGLYRERTGALFALARAPARLTIAASNILALARANWSMPPDHGAAVVHMVLEDPLLTQDWRSELEAMRQRLVSIRTMLAGHAPDLAAVVRQHGMFACLPLTPHQVTRLREQHAVYCAGSGRINLAGLTPDTIPGFTRAYQAVQQDVSD
jgi:aromatic-amino-acid transaminase